jgi:hypothetical protein
MIPLRIKLLTPTAKAPEQANEGDLTRSILLIGFLLRI